MPTVIEGAPHPPPDVPGAIGRLVYPSRPVEPRARLGRNELTKIVGSQYQQSEGDMSYDEAHIPSLEARRREEWRAVDEAGGGVSEGFELAEDDLVEHASHGDEVATSRILRDAGTLDEERGFAVYGEADGDPPSDQ